MPQPYIIVMRKTDLRPSQQKITFMNSMTGLELTRSLMLCSKLCAGVFLAAAPFVAVVVRAGPLAVGADASAKCFCTACVSPAASAPSILAISSPCCRTGVPRLMDLTCSCRLGMRKLSRKPYREQDKVWNHSDAESICYIGNLLSLNLKYAKHQRSFKQMQEAKKYDMVAIAAAATQNHSVPARTLSAYSLLRVPRTPSLAALMAGSKGPRNSQPPEEGHQKHSVNKVEHIWAQMALAAATWALTVLAPLMILSKISADWTFCTFDAIAEDCSLQISGYRCRFCWQISSLLN